MQTSNSPPLETISEGQSSMPDSTGQHGCVEKNVQPIPSNTVGVNSSPSDLLMDEMKIPISDIDAMIGNIDIDGSTEPSNSVASAEPFSQGPFLWELLLWQTVFLVRTPPLFILLLARLLSPPTPLMHKGFLLLMLLR